MSWYYSVNNGAYESKYGQALDDFLDDIAAYVSASMEAGDSYSIKSLMIHFKECDPIELVARDAQVYFDKQMPTASEYSPIYRSVAGRPLYNTI